MFFDSCWKWNSDIAVECEPKTGALKVVTADVPARNIDIASSTCTLNQLDVGIKKGVVEANHLVHAQRPEAHSEFSQVVGYCAAVYLQ